MQRNKKVWFIDTVNKKLSENFLKEAQAIHLLDNDFKPTVINMFKQLKKTMNKELQNTSRTMSQQTKDINKKTDIINRNKITILKLKAQ